MTTIRDRVTGFFRQRLRVQQEEGQQREGQRETREERKESKKCRVPSVDGKDGFKPNLDFVHRYLNNKVLEVNVEDEATTIYSGQTGCDLPDLELDVDLINEGNVFAAFTGPDGGITSLHNPKNNNDSNTLDELTDDDEEDELIDDPRRHQDGPMSLPVMPLQAQTDSRILRQSNGNNRRLSSDQDSHRGRRRRYESVEEDYPELSLDSSLKHSTPSVLDPCRVSADIGLAVAERLNIDNRDDKDTLIAGLKHWQRPNVDATGIATSLYECHPFTKVRAASPIADTFAIAARTNAAVLAIADGVNWGPFSALASRCAVYGAVERVHEELFNRHLASLTTKEVFQCLLRSFDSAQSLIMSQKGHFTTLTLCVVLPVKQPPPSTTIVPHDDYVACVCNVGDSFAYVLDSSSGRVREVTQNCHRLDQHRDMTNVMGALGPFDGRDPDLKNLTCSMTKLTRNDAVFLLSDGISDNVDPVVGKFCIPNKNAESKGQIASPDCNSKLSKKSGNCGQQNSSCGDHGGKVVEEYSTWPPNPSSLSRLPNVTPQQRHKLSLLRLEDIITRHRMDNTQTFSESSFRSSRRSALDVCRLLVDFCLKLTTGKRQLLEDPKLYTAQSHHALPHSAAARMDQKMRRSMVRNKSVGVPGKLDHASVVAYVVKDRRLLNNGRPRYSENNDANGSPGPTLLDASRPRAPCASTEDLTFIESAAEEENDEDDNDNTISSVSSLDN